MNKLNHILLVFAACATSFITFAQPANDDCAGAENVVDDGSCVNGTTVAANDNWTGLVGCQGGPGGPNADHADVWYEFTATNSTLNIDVTAGAGWAGDMEVVVMIPDVSGCAGLFTELTSNCGPSPVNVSTTGLTPGQQYFITVSNPNNGTTGAFTLCTETTVPPSNCTDNDDCSTAATITLNASGNPGDPMACINDCNTGAAQGIDFTGNGCEDMGGPTVWYEFTTDNAAATIDVSITSSDLTQPEFTVWANTCNPWTVIGNSCTEGAGGAASLNDIQVSASTTYYISISDVGGAEGVFDLCIGQNIDQSLCNIGDVLEETSSSDPNTPLGGPYSPGEVVDFCYTINQYMKENCNWLQGIVPTFGDCWDPASFDGQGMPVSVTTPLATASGTAGTWSWYPDGVVLYNDLGGSGTLPAFTPVGAGWFFVCTGCPNGVNGPDPNDSWGDGDANGPAQCDINGNGFTWSVCFQLTAGPTSNCSNGTTDCGLSVKTYADAEIGAYTDLGCAGDQANTYSAGFLCCPTFDDPQPLAGCDSLQLPTITGTGLTGFEEYWTGTNGTGMTYPAGHVFQFSDFGSYPQNLYIYDTSSCGVELPIQFTIQQTPDLNPQADTVVCDSLQLPAISGANLSGNQAYYTGANGTGTQYAAGDWVSTPGTYYIYDSTGAPSSCFDEETFIVTIGITPDITSPAPIAGCDSIQLPIINGTNLTAGVSYYDGPGGTGTPYAIGDWVSVSGTYYIYDNTGAPSNCSDEDSIVVTINTPPVITLTPDDPNSCNGTDGFITVNGTGTGTIDWTGTSSGSSGAGQALNYNIINLGAGAYTVTFTDGTTGCTSAPVNTILNNPGAPIINFITDTSTCEVDFVVPDPSTFVTGTLLTGNQGFYTASGGNSVDTLLPGTVITSAMSPFIIYAFDNNGACSSEVWFTVNVNTNPTAIVAPDPVEYCEGATVNLDGGPAGGSGTYMGHAWTGDVSILNSTAIQNPTTLNTATPATYNLTYTVTDDNGCVGTDDIAVTIVAIPTITNPGTLVACDSVQLPAYAGSNLTPGISYYDGPGGTGTAYTALDWISTSATYYVYDNTGGLAMCSDDESFSVTVAPTPVINDPGTQTACDSVQLPAITGTNLTAGVSYYTGAGGTGISLAAGDWMYSSATVYIYDNTGAPTNCSHEVPVSIVVNPTPVALPTSFTTPICEGEDIELHANTVAGATYDWTGPNSFTSSMEDPVIAGASILDSGTYSLQITLNGCTSPLETVDIVVIVGPVLDPINDTTVCESFGLPVITGSNLSGNQDYYTDSQFNGGTPLTGPLTTSQTVWVYDAVAQCSSEESFVVTVNPLPTASNITGGGTYCAGDAVTDITVDVTGTADWTINYTLDGVAQTATGSTSPISLGNTAGTYIITSVDDSSCSNTASGTDAIVINAIPLAPTAGTDAEYCSTVTMDDLTANGSGGTFTWYSDAALTTSIGTGATFTPASTVGQTTYYVTETLNGCEGPSSQVVISVEVCDIVIPSAFTPNDDGTHDDWEIYNIAEAYPNHVVRVFNRWGNLLFESPEGGYETAPWDGTFNGEPLPVASYYYIIEFNDDEEGTATGTVSIITNK